MADLVIGWLQNLAAGEVTATQSLYTEEKDDVHLLGPSQDGPSRPLQKDNWGNLTEQCILDQTAFRQLVQPIQVCQSFWDAVPSWLWYPLNSLEAGKAKMHSALTKVASCCREFACPPLQYLHANIMYAKLQML